MYKQVLIVFARVDVQIGRQLHIHMVPLDIILGMDWFDSGDMYVGDNLWLFAYFPLCGEHANFGDSLTGSHCVTNEFCFLELAVRSGFLLSVRTGAFAVLVLVSHGSQTT